MARPYIYRGNRFLVFALAVSLASIPASIAWAGPPGMGEEQAEARRNAHLRKMYEKGERSLAAESRRSAAPARTDRKPAAASSVERRKGLAPRWNLNPNYLPPGAEVEKKSSRPRAGQKLVEKSLGSGFRPYSAHSTAPSILQGNDHPYLSPR